LQYTCTNSTVQQAIVTGVTVYGYPRTTSWNAIVTYKCTEGPELHIGGRNKYYIYNIINEKKKKHNNQTL